MHPFRDLEATSGLQFLTSHLYDFEGTHPVHRFTEHTFVIAVPDCLPGKVPNYVSYTRKALQCNMCLSLVGWVLRELNIVPCGEEHEVRLLFVTALPHPPAVLATCLACAVNVAVAFNGRFAGPEEYSLFVNNVCKNLMQPI